MAKYLGKIGFAIPKEIKPNIWVEEITERVYKGDVVRNIPRATSSDKINQNITLNNGISVIADKFFYENFGRMRYVTWNGSKWNITSAEINRPRIVMYMGDLYNGV